MAFAHYLAAAAPVKTSKPHLRSSILAPPLPTSLLSLGLSSISGELKVPKLSFFSKLSRTVQKARATPPGQEASSVVDYFSQFKHLLLPVTDRNPYLSEGTRQAAATTASLAKKYGADILVVVIDEKDKESNPEYDTQISSIRWHLSEGGSAEFKLLERLGEDKNPTAIIGEVADEMNLDLVVMSMEAVHSKRVDANLLAEFIPCPVLLLPL